MAEPFLGEIRLFPIGYTPRGWALCDGQILPINMNQALYALLGNVYGGDGIRTFALPDLRGRVPIHPAPALPQGTRAGEERHTLTVNEIPQHTHPVRASSTDANQTDPAGNVWAQVAIAYTQSTDRLTNMNPGAIANAGASQAHNNMQPYLAVNFCIALTGIFPTRD